jgi:DNA-binding IclR family transcriptional regulator
MESNGVLKGVERAISLLTRFSHERPSLDLAAATRYLRVPRTTAYRVLRSLEAGRMIVYDEGRRVYRLSLALARLGEIAAASIDLREAARPSLRRLVATTGESAFLLVAQDASAVVIDVLESGHPLKLTLPIGTPWPLHAGATNRVLLAHLPPERIAAYLAGPLARVTPATPIDPAAIAADLQAIRARGYAYTIGELTPDVAAVAVPLMAAGRLLGGLAVAGPSSRIRPGRVTGIMAALRRAATTIEHAIGAGGARATGTTTRVPHARNHRRRGWQV